MKLEELEDTAAQCVKTPLEYGAHVDAVNFNGKTALDLALEDDTPCKSVCTELENHCRENLSLQCMAAKAVLKYHRGRYHETNLSSPMMYCGMREMIKKLADINGEVDSPSHVTYT